MNEQRKNFLVEIILPFKCSFFSYILKISYIQEIDLYAELAKEVYWGVRGNIIY